MSEQRPPIPTWVPVKAEFHFTSDRRCINLVRRAAQATAKLVGDKENADYAEQVWNACTDAFEHIQKHAYPNRVGPVTLHIDVHKDFIRLQFLDYGESAPPSNTDGRMDQISYRSGNPNVLEMTKHLPERIEPAK